MKTAKAFKALKKAIQTQPDYAYGFHANIAMMCYDSIRNGSVMDHEVALLIGNDAASRFMKLCFDTETSQDMMTADGDAAFLSTIDAS